MKDYFCAMKYLLALLPLIIFSCQSADTKTTKNESPFAENTIVAADSMHITEETLSRFYFSVIVRSTTYSTKRMYDVSVRYGPNNAASRFPMPKGGEHLKPVMKKGTEPYSYIIGFYLDDDTTFNEYYLVKGSLQQILIKPLAAYTFQ